MMELFGLKLSAAELISLTAAAYWIFSCLSYAMPAPKENAGFVYVFCYRIIHFVAANLDKLRPPLEKP